MKKKTKTQKGITLIALIITIIVLLILAVVAIRAVQGDGIIAHSKDARNKYSKAQIEETIKLLQYEEQLKTMGASSALTMDQISAQEWIKDKSAKAVQDETTGKITITIAKTGEQIEIEGKKPTPEGPEGTYYWVGQNVKELFSLTLKDNNKFEKFVKGYEGGDLGCSTDDAKEYGEYTYNSDTKKIKLKFDWGDVELNYMTLGNNKVLYDVTDNLGCNGEDKGKWLEIYTTNGTEEFKIPENGTYEGTDDASNKIECSINDGVISYKTHSDNDEGLGIMWNDVIYICCGEKGGWSLFKMSGDNLIGYYSGNLGIVFSKVSQ